jgi:hypothetical protein
MPIVGCLDEETIVAFGEGRLAAQAIASVEDHVATCVPCRDLVVAALRAGTMGRVAGAPEEDAGLRGSVVGRYTILGLSGRGGMGEVYAAYDQELDRKIALKLLRAPAGGSDDERGKARLLREAKAMARLSHENVVSVHDAGTFGGRVFVAMKFVDGITLKDWLAEAPPRTQREILRVFTLAGRGLEAAHAAGLVHRDFKPHNVMIGGDGSVRVMDFGLARTMGDDEPPAVDAVQTFDATAPISPQHLTRTGELLGTPLYMAPEQFKAAKTDARTDQFSFCVALYQALYGAPPFGDTTLERLMADVLAGRVQRPPARSTVPGWLRRALLRGLSVEPAARRPSMGALLAALAADPAAARRRLGLAAGACTLVALSAVTVVRRAAAPEMMCRAGPARLGDVWISAAPAPRRQAVKKAFLASGEPTASEIWVRTARLLDRYSDEWLSSYRDACEATHVRRVQAAALLDLRMTCLDEKRSALAALTDVLVTADRGVVSKAIDAANALPSVAACADPESLKTAVEQPRDAVTRDKVNDIRRRAATAKALTDTGRIDRAHELTRALLKDARALGYAPLIAEMLLRFSYSQSVSYFSDELARVTEEAVWLGLAVLRDDVAAEAAERLGWGIGYYLARPAEGLRWLRLGDALIARLGPGHDILRAWSLQDEGSIRGRLNQPARAVELTRAARAIRETILPPDHPDRATGLQAEAEALHILGRDDQAQKMAEEAHAAYVRAYGPGAFLAAVTLSNRAEYLVDAGRPDEAERLLPGVITSWESHVGPRDHGLGYPLTALGRARLALGRPKDAIAPLERANELREAAEPEKLLVAETRFALARALWDSNADRRRALTLADEARQNYAQLGTQPRSVALVDSWLAARSARR